MTTIAYRDGVLAADSMVNYATIAFEGTRSKIARCGKWHVALAGVTCLRAPLEAWAAAGAPEDSVPNVLLEKEDKFTAFFMDDETGDLFEFAGGFLVPVPTSFSALGSGALLALGAMVYGAPAEDAVKAACTLDKASGGTVTVVRSKRALLN